MNADPFVQTATGGAGLTFMLLPNQQDPHLHQAVAYEEVPGAREGEVVDVMAKGYKLGERLLRPALVKVAKAS